MEKTPELVSRGIAFGRTESGMMSGLWHVPVDGFEWRDDLRPVMVDGSVGLDDPPEPTPWLVARGAVARRYPVLGRTNLARDFAELGRDPTQVAILRFASRYGNLGASTMLKQRTDVATPPIVFRLGGGNSEWGEDLDTWQAEARQFWFLWDCWQHVVTLSAIDASSPRRVALARRQLQGRFGWHPDGSSWYRIDVHGALRGGGLITHPLARDFSELSAKLPIGDHVALARYWVMRRVNEELRGHVNPTILPFRNGEVRFVPENLRAAIYLRFALEISEGIGRIRECDGCSRPFTPRRRDQRYCDKNCRERAGYRRRTGGPGTERDLLG